jgi:hypothetical protein
MQPGNASLVQPGLSISMTYSADVGDDTTRAAEIARNLKVRRTSILTGSVFENVNAGGDLCYRARMRTMRGNAETSRYIVGDHEESLGEINAISSTCAPSNSFLNACSHHGIVSYRNVLPLFRRKHGKDPQKISFTFFISARCQQRLSAP